MQDLLIKSLTGFDSFVNCIVLLDTLDGEITGISVSGKQSTSNQRTNWSETICRLPEGFSGDDELIIKLRLRPKRTIELSAKPKDLRNATSPFLAVSKLECDPIRGRVAFNGWCAGSDDKLVVEVLLEGVSLARIPRNSNRPDLAKPKPSLPLMSGFRGQIDLASKQMVAAIKGDSEFDFRLRSTKPGSLIDVRKPASCAFDETEGLRLNAVYTRFKRKLAAMPRTRLEWLLGSERFRVRCWSKGCDKLGWALREACANELTQRLEPGDEIWLRLKNGDKVVCQPLEDTVLARRFLYEAGDEDGFVGWVSRFAKPGMLTIDIGAAYGVVSRALARSGANVVAVEADAVSADRIRRSGLAFDDGEITLVQAACSDASGKGIFAGMGVSTVGVGKLLEAEKPEAVSDFLHEISTLGQVPLRSELTLENKGRKNHQTSDVVVSEVETISIDDLCLRHELRNVGFIKMDIEGGELLAMKGAKRLLDGDFGDPPVIAFEYSTLFPMRGGKAVQLLQLFLDRGWSLWVFSSGKGGGGELIEIKRIEDAPAHDNIVAYPPHFQKKED
ncbi:FkbM family methyltransferase [Tateyamaria sp.]|jgi:FkbM family methyltransferase|nr:FkbM family methyltransferase [Tateyamaria sp.]